MSITQTYRDKLKVIAQGVDTSINNLLNMANTDQLNEVVENHKHIKWSNPFDNESMQLNGLTKSYNGKWWLNFGEELYTPDYQLHDLDLQDVLSFMQTCENVLTNATHEAAV